MSNKDFEHFLRIAIKQGYLSDTKEVSEANSAFFGINYVLRNKEGKVLARITPGLISAKNPDVVPPTKEAKATKAREKAVAWANSMGYPVPEKWSGCLSAFLVVIGLCVYLFPGLILLLIVWNNGNQYERDMKSLVAKWVDAGKPDPGEKNKPVTQLEKIEDTHSAQTSTESRIEEIASMKNKGLISEEEYETLRKKALGL